MFLLFLQIMKAEMSKSRGKTRFDVSSTYFVDVTPTQANVSYINEAIRKHWGGDYKIMTADGNNLEDSEATRSK